MATNKKTSKISDALDRVLPNNLDAEASLFASILLSEDAKEALYELNEDDFYSEAHKCIFNAMYSLYVENQPIDLVTLNDRLERTDKLSLAGGAKYLTSLTNILPSASNYKSYLSIIKRDSVLRKLIHSSQSIMEKAFSDNGETNVLAFAEKEIFDIGKEEQKSSLTNISSSLNEAMEYFDLIARDKDALKGLKTGFYALDKLTNGFGKGELILLAARPSIGKSSFAMNIATNVALNGGKVAVFNLEMAKRELAERSLSSVADINMANAKRGELSSDEWKKLWVAKQNMEKATLMVDDSSLITPIELLSKCRKMKREIGLDLVVVDYLQLMHSGLKSDNRQTEVSEMSRSLKIAAKELDVPILVLSQLSRAVESRTGHRPQLSDLRESGAIEQDADIVMFLHNPLRAENKNTPLPPIQDVELIVAKHRNGSLADIPLKFKSRNTTFVGSTKDNDMESLENSMPMDNEAPKLSDKDVPEMTALDDIPDLDDVF